MKASNRSSLNKKQESQVSELQQLKPYSANEFQAIYDPPKRERLKFSARTKKINVKSSLGNAKTNRFRFRTLFFWRALTSSRKSHVF
jgi:hypothetical protein